MAYIYSKKPLIIIFLLLSITMNPLKDINYLESACRKNTQDLSFTNTSLYFVPLQASYVNLCL